MAKTRKTVGVVTGDGSKRGRARKAQISVAKPPASASKPKVPKTQTPKTTSKGRRERDPKPTWEKFIVAPVPKKPAPEVPRKVHIPVVQKIHIPVTVQGGPNVLWTQEMHPITPTTKPIRKARIPRVVRNTVLGASVIILMLIAGGVVYTYFTGEGTNTSSVAAPVAAKSGPLFKAVQPAVNAKESASVEMITTPLAPGSDASVDVKTNAGSTCTIAVLYNNVASTDPGLIKKIADDYGLVSWSWKVIRTAPEGTWPVKVTCDYNGRSAFVQADLVISKAVQ